MRSLRYLIPTLFCGSLIILGACGGDASTSSSNTDSNVDGKAVYARTCVLCHGDDGKRAINGAKDLTQSTMPLEERIVLIRDGKNLMTAFKGVLSEDEIAAVAKYSMTFKQ